MQLPLNYRVRERTYTSYLHYIPHDVRRECARIRVLLAHTCGKNPLRKWLSGFVCGSEKSDCIGISASVCVRAYDRVKEVIRHGLHKDMYKCAGVCVSFEHR